ncbi:MAG: hypothetical protein EXS37_15135 [Opitutus sp.]|nr:hypothetical protein [Opitutus sp.]
MNTRAISSPEESMAGALLCPDWRKKLQDIESPNDVLGNTVLVMCHALAANATCDAAQSAERAMAGYWLASVACDAARLLEESLPTAGGHPAAPDCGFLSSARVVVNAFHEAARMNPAFFRDAAHFQEWPTLVATNGKQLSRCMTPAGVGLNSAARLPEKMKRTRGQHAPDPSAMFTGLAQELIAYAANCGCARDLEPLSNRTLAKWKLSVKSALLERKAEILKRPEVERWAQRIKEPGYTIWNRLETEVLRKVTAFAKEGDDFMP